MKRILTTLGFTCFALWSDLYAHGGEENFTVLPTYSEVRLDGHAEMKITEVNGSQIVTLATPQYNFLKTNVQITKDSKLSKEFEKLKKELAKPSNLSTHFDRSCRIDMTPNVLMLGDRRVRDKKDSGKKIHIKDQKKLAELYYGFVIQHKLTCKKPINFSTLQLSIFDIAPYLKTVHLTYKNKKGVEEFRKVERPEPAAKKQATAHRKNSSLVKDKKKTKDSITPKK